MRLYIDEFDLTNVLLVCTVEANLSSLLSPPHLLSEVKRPSGCHMCNQMHSQQEREM